MLTYLLIFALSTLLANFQHIVKFVQCPFKNMFLTLELFRKQYQRIKQKQLLRQKQSFKDVLENRCS